ncbi:unnamed protein product [Calypogeia fissa]
MFEGVLYQLLAGYLGHYVKDINREHFRLGLWSGEALLENVEIRLEAFDHLQLPFAIKQGFVGKLRLQLPWSKLGWEPILIALEDVTLLAGPHEESEYGAEASERRALAAKKAGLAAAEFAKLSQRVSEDKSGQTFLSYISAKIIDNVQVTVTKVHIQYVDGQTDPERVFSFGITLSSLIISTTDGRDHPVLPGVSTAGKSGGNRVYKLVEVKQLALYWNSDKSQGSGDSVADDGLRPMHSWPTEAEVVYLLRPTNATLRLTVNKKATQGEGGPIYSVAVNIDDLSLALVDRQLVQMLLLVDVLSMSRLRERYARFRPQISKADSESARIGWQRRLWVFAIQAVLSDVRKHLRRSSWSYLSWRSERQKRYVSLYKEKLESLQRVQPAGDQKWAELEEMEREFEMDEILYFRSLAENQFQLSRDVFVSAGNELEHDGKESDQRQAGELSQQPLGQHRGWLNWLSLGLLGAAESIDAAVCPDEIIKDLCEAAADFNTTAEIESRKSVRGDCRLILSVRVGGTVASLRSSLTKKEIVRMSVGGTLLTFSVWHESSSISITIPTLEIVDLCKPGSQFSRVLAPKTKRLLRSTSTAVVHHKSTDTGTSMGIVHSSSENSLYQASSHAPVESMPESVPEQTDPLLKVEVEMNNKTQDFEVTVNVTIQPVEFVYSPTLVDQTLDFFSKPISLYTRHELVISGSEKLESIAGHTRAKAEFSFATRKRVGWHLDMQRPTFLFPENDVDPEGMLMIWAWESLHITSAELLSTAFSSADMAASQRLWSAIGATRCYERLEVNLVGVQVIIVGQTSNWYERLRHGADLGSHLVESFSLQIAVCCLPSDPTKMTRLKMSGEISSLKLHVSSANCSAVKAVVTRMLESWERIKSKQKDVQDGFANVELGVQSLNSKKGTCDDSDVITVHQRRSSSFHESNQASRFTKLGHMPAVLELNLTMKVVTIQLCVDGQSDSELQHMTMIAQMQDTSLRLKHWDSRDELSFMISRVHIEDANELAGSSLRYLLFYSDGSSSALKETASSSGEIALNSSQSISNRSCFVAKFSRHAENNLRLDLSLQRMECYCHPKVMKALYGFIMTVTDTKTPETSVERQTGSDSLEKKSDIWSRGSTLADTEIEPGLVVGVKLKDVAFHLYDPGGIIGVLVLADANSSVSFMASTKGTMKVIAVIREVRVKGPRWASGNVGGDPFGNSSNGPAATLTITITKTWKRSSFSGLEYGVAEVDAAVQNARWILLNDYFAVLIGYCLSSEWKFSLRTDNSAEPTDLESMDLSSDSRRTVFLFKLEVSDSVIVFPREPGVEEHMEVNIPKLLVSFTPAELARIEGHGITSLVSDSSLGGVDIVCMECRNLAVTFHGFHQYLESIVGDQFRLVENVEGEMIIKIPTSEVAAEASKTGISSAIPIMTQIDLSDIHFTLAGWASKKGMELLKRYQKELSSIPWKYKAYASVGFRYGLRDRSPFVQLTAPPSSDSSLSLKSSISHLTVFVRAPDEPSVNVSRLQADSVNVYLFLNQGVMEIVKIELLSLELLCGSSSKTLFSVTAENDSNGRGDSADDLIPLLSLANSELQIALPCTKVWLHLVSWSKIISALVSLGSSSQVKHANAASVSSSDQTLLQSDGQSSAVQSPNEVLSDGGILDSSNVAVGGCREFVPNPIVDTSKTQDDKNWPVQLKVGVLNVVFILPDYVAEAKPDQHPLALKRKQSRPKLLWTGLGDVEDFYTGSKVEAIQDGDRSTGKQVLLTWSVRIDEIQVNREGLCTLSAYIMHAEAAVEETFGEGQRFHMRFLQANDIRIKGQINLEHSRKNSYLAVEVDCVDAWCSYNILHFLNGFHLEPVKTVSSSSATEFYCSLDLRLQSCSLLLSDSRWSCNAPIFEIVLKKILSQVVWNRFDIEASSSSELEIHYHNIQKATWEPLIEPWSVCSKITRLYEANTPSSSKPFRTKFELTSSAPLHVNVTDSLIQAISRAVEMFGDSWKERNGDDDFKIRDPQSAESSSMRRYAPYWLQNDTGVPLSYWLCGASRSKENDDDAKTSSFGSARSSWGSLSGDVVQPGCSVPLYVEEGPDEAFVRRRAGKSSDGYNARKIFNMLLLHRMICVQLEGTSRPSVPLSIDLVGSVSFEAIFSDDSGDGGSRPNKGSFQEIESERGGSFSAPVIFEVTVQRYSKLVRVCSMVSLVNTTSVALELRFDIPFLISPKVMDPILPGHVMPLPVHLAETGRMRWRPLGNNHLWSEVQLLPNLLEIGDTRLGFHRPVVCYPVNPSNGAFRCCIAVENHPIPAAEAVAASKSKGEQRDVMGRSNGIDNLGIGSSNGSDDTKGCILWDIFLKAPLVVKNCLPCLLAITIETSAGVMSNVSAPEAHSIFVYDIDTTQDLTLTFLAFTFLPSSVKVANATSFSTEMGRIVAQDMKVTVAQQLHFNPEVTTNASVTADMEIDLDLVSGARELRISAPFWLYNCSYLNLAVMDGDVDLFSGREHPLGGGPTNDEERVEELSLHSTGSRSWPTSVNGLQVSLEGPKHESRDIVVKRPARLSSQLNGFSVLPRPVHFSLEKKLGKRQEGNSADSQSLNSEEEEKSVKENVNSQFLMYSPVQGTDASELHLRLRIVRSQLNELGEVRWSRPFLLEPPGGTTAVAIPQPEGNGAFVVAVVSAPALGSCAGKTKTITFRPRFLLANVSKQVLCYKQQGTDKFQRLERGKHSQLHWHDVSREFLVSMRIDEHGWDWSGAFAPDQLGDTQVKVRNHTTGMMHMLRVEVSSMLASAGGAQIAGPAGGSLGTYLILLSDDETGFMPYRIENFTLERLRFHQQKCEKMENMLQPYSSCSYAWDEPCRPHRLIIEVPGAGDLGAFWLDEVKEYPPVTLPATSEKAERKWLVHVRAEGPIRVLSIVDGTVHTMKGTGGVDGASTGDQFQETGQSSEANAELFEEFAVNLSYVGFSVIDTQPQEVIYACAKGLKLQLLQGRHQKILKLDVAWLQVDNQLRYAVYPVMLSVARAPPESSTVPQGTRTNIQPMDSQLKSDKALELSKDATFSISVAKWSNPAGSVDCFQYIRMRLEPLRLELEERVVSCLLHLLETMSWSAFSTDSHIFVAFTSEPWSVLHGSQLYGSSRQPFATTPRKYDMVHIPASNIMRFTKLVKRLDAYRCWASAVAVEPINWQSQKLFLFAKERRKAYIEMLHVAPIVLNVSFSSAPWLSDEMGGAATRSLLWMTGTLLQRQVRALADVEGAPVHLRQLKLAHPFASWDVIRGMITRHYTRQLLQEVYKVLGSADVFGNPVGFIRSMASGMWEFVSAPTRSSVQSPTELVRGVARGTSSLFTNTVFAFSNAATRMSRAARKGVTVFTFDSEYDQAMERLLRLEGSQEISVVNEFLEGLTGLLQAPIRGAERHGLPGMLSGMALGVVGVVARPVASILEVAGMTAQSIRNRSRPIQWHATRVRLPRHVNDYSPLMLYSWERAVGQAVLLEAEGGRFKNEVYFTCKPLVQEGTFLLLTESKILRVSTATLADATAASNAVYGPKWKLDLEGEIDDILHVDQADNEVSVLLGPPMRPLIRPHHHGVGSSKYTTRFTPFAHETFALVSQSASDEVIEMLRLLDEQHRKARSKLLLASSTSLSSPEFLDLDKYF